MIIHVSQIPWEGLDVAGELAAAALDLGHEAGRLRVSAPVECRMRAHILAHEVLVRGELSLRLEFACCRCGEFFAATVSEPRFQEVYPFEDGHEMLDLTSDIRESIILAFPSFPRCEKTCRGLCPQCGKNLNRLNCRCNQQALGDRWAAALDMIPERLKTDCRS